MLSDQDATFWWLALGFGAFVVIAVVFLLGFLITYVKIIDKSVVDVRDTLRKITKNTAHTTLIPKTADGVDAVLAEGLQHHLFLGRALAAIPTPAGE